jgi:hypothetical protein
VDYLFLEMELWLMARLRGHFPPDTYCMVWVLNHLEEIWVRWGFAAADLRIHTHDYFEFRNLLLVVQTVKFLRRRTFFSSGTAQVSYSWHFWAAIQQGDKMMCCGGFRFRLRFEETGSSDPMVTTSLELMKNGIAERGLTIMCNCAILLFCYS